MTTTPDDPYGGSPLPPASLPPPPDPYAIPPIVAPPVLPAEPLNPWFSIWVMPRATMRQILDTNPRRLVHVLAILGGIVEAIGAHIPDFPGVHLSLASIVTMKVCMGAIGGILGLYILSLLLWMTGSWLGGKGGFVESRAAVGWSNVPAIWGLMLLLPMLAYVGTQALNLDPETLFDEPSGLLLMVPLGMMAFALAIWRIVIFCKLLGEAHRFSAWHAFGAVLIACVIVVIPFIILAILAVGLMGLAS